MKLNHDCVREFLLYIEDNVEMDQKPVDVRDVYLKRYSENEIRYAAKKLSEAGYIKALMQPYDDEIEIYIKEITWEGHKFLDTIRDNEVWRKTKGFLAKFASVSLSFTADVASQVIATMLSQYMQLPPPQYQP